MGGIGEGPFSVFCKETVSCANFSLHCSRRPKVSKGRSESPWVASAEAKPFVMQEKKGKPFSCLSQDFCFLWDVSPTHTRMGPEGVQGAIEKPPGRLRRGETHCDAGKKGKPFSHLPQGICFLWEVSPACGRTRYFPRAGKYPKGAGGVQRVHVSWPPPDPPLLSYSAPLASQGRAQLGSLPSLGGPLSPSRLAFTS